MIRRIGMSAVLMFCLISSAPAQDFSVLEGPYRALALGSEGRVFVGGERELLEVDPEARLIVMRWPARIERLAGCADGSVWGLGEEGLFRLDQEQGRIESIAALPSTWKGNASGLMARSAEDVVVSSSLGGISRIYFASPNWREEVLRAEESTPAPIGELTIDRDEQLWWLGDCGPSSFDRRGPGGGACTLFRKAPDGEDLPVFGGVSGIALGPEALPSVVLEDGTVVFPAGNLPLQEAPLSAMPDRYLVTHGCDGAVWLSGWGDRAVWESSRGAWIRRASAPAEIGNPVALSSRCPGGEVYLLGEAGLARWTPEGPSELVHLAALEERISRSLLVGVAVSLVLIAFLIAMAAFVYRKYRRGPPRRWSIADGLVGVTTFVIFQGGFQLILMAAWGMSVEDPLGLLISFFAAALTACAWIALRMRQNGLRAREIGLCRDALPREVVWGVVAVLPAWLLVAGTVLLSELAGLPKFLYAQEATTAFMAREQWSELLAVAIIGVVLAPLVEELLFRGFLLTAIRKRWGAVPAALITALLFGAIHIEGILTVGALGLVFAVLTLWRRSLVPAIVAHALINAVSLAILFAQ